MTDDVLLVSIRPQFADMIFEGTKTVELRRTKPRVTKGDWVLVYVSSPVKALKGVFQVTEVLRGKPKQLWPKVKDVAGISKRQFDDYYDGAPVVYAIGVRNARNLDEPVRLEELRERIDRFHPPQTYRYITRRELRTVGVGQWR